MANETEKTIWETIFGALAGVVGTVGFTTLLEGLKKRMQTAVANKANELVTDTGRTALLRDILALEMSSSPKDAEAGKNVREWLIKAQAETATGRITEGEIVNLLNKCASAQPGQRITILRGLGRLPSYEDFVNTVGILRHDNIMQLAVKLAERMRTTGGSIIDDDLHAIREALGTSARNLATTVNNAAGDALPYLQGLRLNLRRFRESRS